MEYKTVKNYRCLELENRVLTTHLPLVGQVISLSLALDLFSLEP